MIRRNYPLDGEPTHWLLISQVEHARLSRQLAEQWKISESSSAFSAELLDAIEHHDDGWRVWETQPRLDPVHGRPISFMELEPEEAILIWDRSIATAASIGPLAAWVVAGHFAALMCKHESLGPAQKTWLRDTAERRQAW